MTGSGVAPANGLADADATDANGAGVLPIPETASRVLTLIMRHGFGMP